MTAAPAQVRNVAAKVRVLALDVDGVLTDGRLWYGPEGEEIKQFHVRDGLGIRLLIESGIHVAIITARESGALQRRARDLGIQHVMSGRRDKYTALEELCAALAVSPADVAFAGDDLLDVPVLEVVGLPITVADGHATARAAAAWITTLPGGQGAVREVADGLLEARGALQTAAALVLPRKST